MDQDVVNTKMAYMRARKAAKRKEREDAANYAAQSIPQSPPQPPSPSYPYPTPTKRINRNNHQTNDSMYHSINDYVSSAPQQQHSSFYSPPPPMVYHPPPPPQPVTPPLPPPQPYQAKEKPQPIFVPFAMPFNFNSPSSSSSQLPPPTKTNPKPINDKELQKPSFWGKTRNIFGNALGFYNDHTPTISTSVASALVKIILGTGLAIILKKFSADSQPTKTSTIYI